MSKPVKKITTYLVITILLSSILYIQIIHAHSIAGYSFLLMWCPGIAAIITQLIFERSLRGMGWKLRPIKYQLVSYLTPLGYALVAYLVLWGCGLGHFAPGDVQQEISAQMNLPASLSTPIFVSVYFLISATLTVFFSAILALGEEIGWRGLLVPELAKITSYPKVGLISGLIWAAYHVPLILFADYNNEGVSVWYGLICFTVMIVAISYIFAWLRLRSGSLWTGVIMHAAHNTFIQSFFDQMTSKTGLTGYFAGEFGVLIALATIGTALIFWRKRQKLPQPKLLEASRSE